MLKLSVDDGENAQVLAYSAFPAKEGGARD
jgi:hypothetical protein